MSEPGIDVTKLRLSAIKDRPTLTELLSLLFEPTPALREVLVPDVLARLETTTPESYDGLIDLCADAAGSWTWGQKAEFIQGHPMIGAPKVTGLSGKEQGGGPVTPQVVLDRLDHLNALYCTVYPGLRYITFVNGRSRAAIIPGFEETIGLDSSPTPLPNDYPISQPALDSEETRRLVKEQGTEEWKAECERCLADVWAIGKARVVAVGLKP